MSSTDKSSAIAAVAQLCSTDNIDANLATCEDLAQQAADRGARLLVLPECFAFLGLRERDKFAVAEYLDPKAPGRILSCLMGMAEKHDMWILGGGIPERLAEDKDKSPDELRTAFNTLAAVSPEAKLAACYRKIHLFDVDIPGGATLKESAATSAGQDLAWVDTTVGRVGLSICYDLRFPELFRKLTLDEGCNVLTVPAAFTAHTGAAHWHTLLRARAIENQCWMLASGQTGRHNEKRASYGHSMVIDPWGVIRDEVVEGTGIAVAEIDHDFTSQKRAQLPCLSHVTLRKDS